MDSEIFKKRAIYIITVFHTQRCQHVCNTNASAEPPDPSAELPNPSVEPPDSSAELPYLPQSFLTVRFRAPCPEPRQLRSRTKLPASLCCASLEPAGCSPASPHCRVLRPKQSLSTGAQQQQGLSLYQIRKMGPFLPPTNQVLSTRIMSDAN